MAFRSLILRMRFHMQGKEARWYWNSRGGVEPTLPTTHVAAMLITAGGDVGTAATQLQLQLQLQQEQLHAQQTSQSLIMTLKHKTQKPRAGYRR